MEHFKLFFSVVGVLSVLALTSSATAHPQESPFKPGTMEIDTIYLSPDKDGCPLYTTLYYPQKPGYYTPIFFLGGIYDLVSTKYYKSFLEDIARHGYMVFGIDMFAKKKNDTSHGARKSEIYRSKTMVQSHLDREAEYKQLVPNFLQQMKWLEHHTRNRTKSRANWNKITLSCQSASCSIILHIVQNYPRYAAAAVFIDPVCLNSKHLKPKFVHTKALSYVSSKSFIFPFCCIKGFGYKRVYDLMTNIKVRMSVRDFGHCGLMEMNEWSLCHRTGVCHTGAESQVEEYQQFTAGMIHAFIRWTLYMQVSMRRYLIDESQMPLALDDLAYELHPDTMTDTSGDLHFDPNAKDGIASDPNVDERRFSVV